MIYSNIIEMDIWSAFGSFSKPFSNSGGLLTYLIPPKTSIIGIIAAILGYEFDDFKEDKTKKVYKIEELYEIKVSIQPLFDLKTKRIIFNNRTNNKIINIRQDILLNPYYKLYISFPESLKKQEKEFLKKIKNNETVYSLYMGRNEFPLNYKYENDFPNYEIILTEENSEKFFKDEPQIYGSLNHKNVYETELNCKTSVKIIFYENYEDVFALESFYEYIIKDFPIKRENFTDFTYSPISFYSMHNNKDDCYFSYIKLIDDTELKLSKIGENKWISMI
ncbi:MAG: CRISPR-associated protein Cas5 [Methanobacteriaceae archaeon]|nr:CRISPR-associated protein Cas5 [Methanobacteriaceae archaeon]